MVFISRGRARAANRGRGRGVGEVSFESRGSHVPSVGREPRQVDNQISKTYEKAYIIYILKCNSSNCYCYSDVCSIYVKVMIVWSLG